MDALFLLDEADRSSFLRFLIQSFSCTYICLWSYVPHPSNCLIFHDGCYKEESNQPSSSTGSALPLRLFIEYQNTIFPLENDIQVPGFAFRNNTPYLEIKDFDLLRLAFNQTQRRFYQEAGVKKAVFMGCRVGEIEIGFSNETEINVEMGMREIFPEDFSRQSPPPPLGEIPHQQLPPAPPPPDPTPMASTSSSSLRSLSTESPDSSLIFNIPSTSNIVAEISGTATMAAAAVDPMQVLSQIRGNNIRLPMLETEHNTMTQAFLAVLTSPSSTSSTSTSHCRHPQRNPPYNYQLNPKSSAFKRYASPPPPPLPPTCPQIIRSGVRKSNLLNRAFLYYRNLHIVRRRSELMLGSGGAGGGRPSTTQLHHMMSERKRREKLNESFQTLRSLLPPATKRDKASVLERTKEYLTTLKEQVAELSRRNLQLEEQIFPYKVAAGEEVARISPNERMNVRISPVAESPTEGRITDLRISVRGECLVTDLMIRLLEFLKQDRNVSVMSMESNTIEVEAGPLNFIYFRLRIESNEWNEPAFMEAARRLVANLAQ